MTDDGDAPRLVYVLTHASSADRLVQGQLEYMREHGFDVTVVASPGEQLDAVARREGVHVVALPMEREMSPLRDLRSLIRLTKLLFELEPDLVNAGTAKAGLLGMIAATVVRVPARVYVLRGLRLETERGLRRAVLTITEAIASRCAHRIICNSESLRREFLALGVAPIEKTTVLGAGSSNGVDAPRFMITDERRREARELAEKLGLPSGVRVVGFVGRLAGDKGLDALLSAFDAAAVPNARLLLVGDFDATDPPRPELVKALREHPRAIITGFVREPAPYYALMDVLVFPSRREGFPNVPLEAACAEVPVVGYRATGTVDAIVDGETGAIVDIGDTRGLTEAIRRYLSNDELRSAHGRAASTRAVRDFQQERVWQALESEYRKLLRRSRERTVAASLSEAASPRRGS